MPDTFFRNEKIGGSRLQYNVFLIDSSGQEKLSREIGFFFFDLFNMLTLKRYSRKFIVFFPGQFHNILAPNLYIRVFPDGDVLYSIRCLSS